MANGNPSRYSELARRARVPLGYGLGAAFAIFAQPEPALLAAGLPLSLLGLAIRGWASGFLEKNEKLATGGPYALTRNPLYLGTAFLGTGLAVAGGTWPLGVCFLLLLIFVYRPVMRKEEAFLAARFGAAFAAYAAEVPFFLPRHFRHIGVSGRSAPTEQRFLWSRYKRNREYQAGLGLLATAIFLAVKHWLR